MSRDTDNNLFIVSSGHALYQQLLKGIASNQVLAGNILSAVKTAYDFRRTERVRELSRILIHLPVGEYQLIGEYYLIWCECRELRFHIEPLEWLIGQTQTYKAQALLSRGTFDLHEGKAEAALYFYLEGLKTSHSVSDRIGLSLAVAQLKSIEGFHKSSLGDLENLIPILGHADPRLYYDFLNSYAVELDKEGRSYEARNVCKLVLSSPFIDAYPEWRETARDLREPNRSFVTVPLIECEPAKTEATQAEHESKPEQEGKVKPATVIAFPQLKEAPPQKPEPFTPQELGELTAGQKRELILAAIRSRSMPEGDYDKMLVMVGLLKAGTAPNVIDLEDEALLGDIVVTWVNLIEPEEFTAVMSALRDCEDRIRRRDIMDRMIRIAFEESQECGLTEEQWRLRVERRLPKR
jgi:hypothetical protein